MASFRKEKNPLVSDITFFQKIAHAVPAMVAVYDIRTGKYLFVNDGIKKILGYTAEDFLNKGVPFAISLVHPDDLPLIMEKNQQALERANKDPFARKSKPIVSFEYRMRHKNGEYIWLLTEGTVFTRDQRQKVASVLNTSIDISEQKSAEEDLINFNRTLQEKISLHTGELKKSEEKLRESEERYKQFIYQSNDGIWRFEVEKPISTKLSVKKQVDLCFANAYLAECNDAMARMYGYKKGSDLIGARLPALLVPTDKKNRDFLKVFIQNGYKIVNAESHEKDKQGKDKYFLNNFIGVIENNHIVRAWGIQKDITKEREIQEAVKAYHQKIEEVLESINDGFYSVDYSWKLQYVNAHILKLWNKKREEVLGRSIWDVFPNAVGSTVYKELAKAAKTKKARKFEWFSTVVNRWVELRIYPTKTGISVYSRDISELKEQKKQLEVILKNISDGITVQDENGKVIYANDAAAKLIGFRSVNTFLKIPITKIMDKYEMLDEAGSPLPIDKLPGRVALQGKKSSAKIIRFRIKETGDEHWSIVSATPVFDARGKVSLVINVIHDITEFKQAEEKVKQSERYFRSLTEKSWDAILKTDLEGIITYVSPSVERILGYSPRHILGKKAIDFLHPDDLERIMKAGMELLKRGGTITVQARYRHINGKWLWLESNVTNLINDPNIQGFVSNFRDITERQRLESLKDEFIGLASHELKTPLTSMKAYTQVLHRSFQKKGDSESALLLGKMDLQINKLTNLISDLLDITRIQEGKLAFIRETFDANTLISEIAEELQRTTDMHTIELQLDKTISLIGDRDRYSQVLLNLLSNALKYSPTAGKIIIISKNNKTCIQVSVKDFGIGIPKEKQQFIFDRFYRVQGENSKTYTGLGLGLYISKEIVERQGGKLWFESIEGKGSTFHFTIPLTSGS